MSSRNNFFRLGSNSTATAGSGGGQMIDYYKVLPSYFLFKQIEQFVNRVDIRSVFDPTDLTIMSHTVDCFKRMNYTVSARTEAKIFQASFICFVSRFFSFQDEDSLNEVVLLLFDSNADRLIPNHVLTLLRGFVCRRITSFVAEKKAVKHLEMFMDLINNQVIEFENECTKSPDHETFYNDQAFYADLRETILEHVENHNFHLFAEVLSNADLILENDDESEFLSKLAHYKRKSIQHDTLLTEITINSSKLTRRSHAIQNVDEDTLIAAGRHFLERTGAFTELTNLENQTRSPVGLLKTPSASRRSKQAPEQNFRFDEELPDLDLAASKGSPAALNKSRTTTMSSQQVLQQLEQAPLEYDNDQHDDKSPVVKARPAKAVKSKKKLYTDDNALLQSGGESSAGEELDDDELDFGHSPAKSKSKLPAAKINALELCQPKNSKQHAGHIPDVDFDGNGDEDDDDDVDDGSRPTTSKEAAKRDLLKKKNTAQKSTPLKFVEICKKTMTQQMAERRPLPITAGSTPVSKKKPQRSDSEDDDEGDKENRSTPSKPAAAKHADDSSDDDSSSDHVASFSKSPAAKKAGGDGGGGGAKPRKKVRRPWTETETTYLMAGIITYGMGNWSRILKEYSKHFNERNSMDLRDKYRNLEKQNNLKRFEKLAKILIEKLASRRQERAKNGQDE